MKNLLSNYGRIPPQANELEESVLGAVLLEKDAIDIVEDIIPSPDCFYVNAHQKIYAAVLSLKQKGIPIDILTITTELSNSGELIAVGGPYYITSLTMNVVSGANVESHSRVVMEKYMLRELINISGEAAMKAYEQTEDVFELIDITETKIAKIVHGNVKSNYYSSPKLAMEALEELQRLINNPSELTGVPTGFKYMDAVTSGWQKQSLIIIAGRPSMGKTALALALIVNAAINGTGIGFFSLEMSRGELTKRILSQMSGVGLSSINKGIVNEDELKAYQAAADLFSRLNIKIDESSSPSMAQVRGKARRMVTKENIELIVIDYLQLMRGDGKNREQEIASIAGGLKNLAKELNIPIIALAQLNRAVEGRANGIPVLSDLRESGAIEQDADIVAFIYGERMGEKCEDGSIASMFNLPRNVKFAKNRNGSCETVELRFNATIQKFSEPTNDFGGFRPIVNTNSSINTAFNISSQDKKELEEKHDDLPF